MTRTPTLLAALLVVIAVTAATTTALVGDRRQPGPGHDEVQAEAAASSPSSAGRDFLDTYVEPDGRVVRRDQGNDTVSEGQAYGMLIALTEGDEHTFRKVWRWTRHNLQRDDLLLSWHWADGRVVDRGAASDADLDTARALVLAGRRFDNRRLAKDGVLLAQAVMEHETVKVPEGRLLVAGPWAVHPPYWFNPSYVSPVATELLEGATGDHRWQEVEQGSRAAVVDLTSQGLLPPDWARVTAQGDATASGAPGGATPRYAYDAARTMVRHAESCQPVDQQVAEWAAARLGIQEQAYAVLHLDGAPMVDHQSPVALAARAASYARSGWHDQARADLASGDRLDRDWPSYYGAAWSVLGRRFLTDPTLGGCPPLEGAR